MFDPNMFSVADVQFLKRLGFADKDLITLYHDEVPKVSENMPETNNPIRLL